MALSLGVEAQDFASVVGCRLRMRWWAAYGLVEESMLKSKSVELS